MPQRAMVRIWVASLHQKDQRRKYAGLFLLQKTKVTPLRVDSNSCGPALASRRAKKPQWGFFSSAARRIHPRPPKIRDTARAGPSPSFRQRNATSPEGRGFGSAERSPCLYKDLPALHPHHCQGYGCLLYTENHPQNEWFSSYNKAETVQDRLCQMFYTTNPGAMPEKAQPSIRLLPVISAGTGRPT